MKQVVDFHANLIKRDEQTSILQDLHYFLLLPRDPPTGITYKKECSWNMEHQNQSFSLKKIHSSRFLQFNTQILKWRAAFLLLLFEFSPKTRNSLGLQLLIHMERRRIVLAVIIKNYLKVSWKPQSLREKG